jgi:hypothetical protein
MVVVETLCIDGRGGDLGSGSASSPTPSSSSCRRCWRPGRPRTAGAKTSVGPWPGSPPHRFLAHAFPSRSPGPTRPVVPGRPHFVAAAPTSATVPWPRLPPASTQPLRRPGDEGLPPASGQTAPRGAPPKRSLVRSQYRPHRIYPGQGPSTEGPCSSSRVGTQADRGQPVMAVIRQGRGLRPRNPQRTMQHELLPDDA